MADTYSNFAELAAAEPEGVAWRVRRQAQTTGGTRVLHLAIHAGGIEPGTGEAALAAALNSGKAHYLFEGLLSSGNSRLHITSTNFDEPRAVESVQQAMRVVSWHGAAGTTPQTFIGGLDVELRDAIMARLQGAGFAVQIADDTMQEIKGTDPENIANRGLLPGGVQLELTRAMRDSFFPSGVADKASRDAEARTDTFWSYVGAVVEAVESLAPTPPPQPAESDTVVPPRRRQHGPEWMRFEVLDLRCNHVGWMGREGFPQVQHWQMTWKQDATIHATGSMVVDGDMDWSRYMVLPWRYQRVGGQTLAHPRFPFLIDGGEGEVEEAVYGGIAYPSEHRQVTLWGQERLVQRHCLDVPYYFSPGNLYTDIAGGRLDGVVGNGQFDNQAITRRPDVLKAGWSYPAGTTRLKVVNDVAQALNYWSLRFDVRGTAVLAPYRPPRDRPIEFDLRRGADDFKRVVKWRSDSWNVPNMLTGTARQEGDKPPLWYTAHNYNDGPYSREQRGYWQSPIDQPPIDVDAPDMDTLIAVMERKLAAASWAPLTVEADILWQPFHGDEVGWLVYGGLEVFGSLIEWSESSDLSAPMHVRIEEAKR